MNLSFDIGKDRDRGKEDNDSKEARCGGQGSEQHHSALRGGKEADRTLPDGRVGQ